MTIRIETQDEATIGRVIDLLRRDNKIPDDVKDQLALAELETFGAEEVNLQLEEVRY